MVRLLLLQWSEPSLHTLLWYFSGWSWCRPLKTWAEINPSPFKLSFHVFCHSSRNHDESRHKMHMKWLLPPSPPVTNIRPILHQKKTHTYMCAQIYILCNSVLLVFVLIGPLMYTCNDLCCLPWWDLELPRKWAPISTLEGISTLISAFDNVYEEFSCSFG